MAIIIQAKGVLVAPAKTATNPIPANNPTGKGTNNDKALPKVAPIKNNGVTSPPLNPAESVRKVNAIFKAKSYIGNCASKDATIVGIPNPIYLVVPIAKTAKATMLPPITGRKGGYLIFDLKMEVVK